MRRAAAVLLASAVLGGGLFLLLRRGEPHRPDVVLVVWDTVRADRLSAYGHRADTTPWLREFAKEGVLFRQAFTPSPWTPPAHASLFTGLLPRNHGLLQGRGDRVAKTIPLLAQTLKAAGYETVGFTANAFLSPATGLSDGFERMTPLYENERGAGAAESDLAEIGSWLEERRRAAAGGAARRPLFLFVNFMDAHLPRTPTPEDLRAVTGDETPSPDVARALQVEQKRAMRHLLGIETLDAGTLAGMAVVYDACLRHLDDNTRALAGMLREAGILDRAFAAVVSDHGEHLGEHGKLNHQMSLHDPLLRIPMVVRWPGRLEGGRVEDAQVRLQDLHPTILEAAGIAPPPGTARDAIPLTESPLRARPLIAEFVRPLAYLREARESNPAAEARFFAAFHVTILARQDPAGTPGARKFLVHERQSPEGERFVEREELYDLAADPGELRNLLLDPSDADRAAAKRLASGL